MILATIMVSYTINSYCNYNDTSYYKVLSYTVGDNRDEWLMEEYMMTYIAI